ncbi:hypothetical protein ABB37_09115 [Leptomonas pyrrhocoris]|uniref:Uncharacterized protein n=1 Tax=Leptomonas pyrrhocoris TaxID=157538 RepID=A0A0N0DRF6_LEPPY|nr:hypothetical protein ABB37_09115 [Leptomonas pyrrhocoris]KPA74414.1 hypothetical protein ABB37_09115 [Leptomonas pyrrhocoris]|eukprot:XP_015652853.1 hypothetical protein ABB37_09115 [Leptomonas pyrrhocoris]
MDSTRQQPRVDVGKAEEGDLVRESSLLPGEVRTPTMVVSLSDAWGDVSGDWAAPGSSVWEEDAPSRHSGQTLLTGYGREGDVWASGAGSPLLGDDDGVEAVSVFAAAAAAAAAQDDGHPPSSVPDAAELAAGALHGFVPHGAADRHVDPRGLQRRAPSQQPSSNPSSALPLQREGPPRPFQPSPHPRYAPDVHYNYEGRFGTVHASPASDPIRGTQNAVPMHTAQQQQQRQQQSSYFTVQEGGGPNVRGGGGGGGGRAPYTSSSTVRNFDIPVLANDVNQHVGSGGNGGGLFSQPGNGGASFVPRLDDEDVAQSIIASAGLPLSLHSLVNYIRGGQPQAVSYVSALGSTQNALRNYPNLNEPPGEEDALSNINTNSGGAGGARGGRLTLPAYTQSHPPSQQGRWKESNPPAADNTGFAVRGSDFNSGGGAQHTPSPPSTFHTNHNDLGGGFVVSAGNAATANPRGSLPAGFGVGLNSSNVSKYTSSHGDVGGGGGVVSRPKSESEYLSDLLHFHANFFPPPPPPRVPKEERRNRAELWYHYASKWDITHRLPPPPRTPLPEMEMEYRMRLQRMTRVPYHGDGWLKMSERWFDVTQTLFDFPAENMGVEVDFSVVLQQAVLS